MEDVTLLHFHAARLSTADAILSADSAKASALYPLSSVTFRSVRVVKIMNLIGQQSTYAACVNRGFLFIQPVRKLNQRGVMPWLSTRKHLVASTGLNLLQNLDLRIIEMSSKLGLAFLVNQRRHANFHRNPPFDHNLAHLADKAMVSPVEFGGLVKTMIMTRQRPLFVKNLARHAVLHAFAFSAELVGTCYFSLSKPVVVQVEEVHPMLDEYSA